jgi:hypothetical protein
MTSGTSGWITLLAGLGIGSVVAALVSWWSTKAVTISNHRQNWINALRDDLVTIPKGNRGRALQKRQTVRRSR